MSLQVLSSIQIFNKRAVCIPRHSYARSSGNKQELEWIKWACHRSMITLSHNTNIDRHSLHKAENGETSCTAKSICNACEMQLNSEMERKIIQVRWQGIKLQIDHSMHELPSIKWGLRLKMEKFLHQFSEQLKPQVILLVRALNYLKFWAKNTVGLCRLCDLKYGEPNKSPTHPGCTPYHGFE